jgi:hypothetical protein
LALLWNRVYSTLTALSNMKIRVWVCVSCGTKDVDIISKEEALRGEEPKQWWDDEDDDGYRE